jgi:glutathione-independent formaldehyde dehydrogenase
VQQIKDVRATDKARLRLCGRGEEKMDGVNCAIDAVGYQARSQRNHDKEDPMQTVRQIAEVINPTGSARLIGVYFDEDPGGVDKHAKKSELLFPPGSMWNKGVTIGQGQAPVKKHNVYLRDLIIAGKAKPSFYREPPSGACQSRGSI